MKMRDSSENKGVQMQKIAIFAVEFEEKDNEETENTCGAGALHSLVGRIGGGL